MILFKAADNNTLINTFYYSSPGTWELGSTTNGTRILNLDLTQMDINCFAWPWSFSKFIPCNNFTESCFPCSHAMFFRIHCWSLKHVPQLAIRLINLGLCSRLMGDKDYHGSKKYEGKVSILFLILLLCVGTLQKIMGWSFLKLIENMLEMIFI